MKKVLKWSAVVFSMLFLGAQAYRPARTNPPVDASKTIGANTRMTPEVAAVFERSCNDCHSSETAWPWYSQVAPASWFLAWHVEEGRRELSFSEWATYSKRKRERKLHEICRQVESGEMPLRSYLPLHPSARLSEEDRRAVCEWARAEEARQQDAPAAEGGGR
ncbi:MAG TPA: heme-binding domain-containing protein [Pyrinomonadaceae bacterium]